MLNPNSPFYLTSSGQVKVTNIQSNITHCVGEFGHCCCTPGAVLSFLGKLYPLSSVCVTDNLRACLDVHTWKERVVEGCTVQPPFITRWEIYLRACLDLHTSERAGGREVYSTTSVHHSLIDKAITGIILVILLSYLDFVEFCTTNFDSSIYTIVKLYYGLLLLWRSG